MVKLGHQSDRGLNFLVEVLHIVLLAGFYEVIYVHYFFIYMICVDNRTRTKFTKKNQEKTQET